MHCGPLVSLGYWNDLAATAERFRALPVCDGRMQEQTALWSGDTVRLNAEGFHYFIARSDDVIKTGGYRASPTEVEEVIGATGRVAEAAAVGVVHPVLGRRSWCWRPPSTAPHSTRTRCSPPAAPTCRLTCCRR